MTGLHRALLISDYAVLEFKSSVILQLLSILKKNLKNQKADNLLESSESLRDRGPYTG